jgi:hypothetical protein
MRMRLAACLLVLTGADTVPAAETTQRFEIPLRHGEKVIVSEINGPVEITTSPDRRIVIEFVRMGHESLLPAGSLSVEHLPGVVLLQSSDFTRDGERIRNRLRIRLPDNTALEVTAIRGDLAIGGPLADVRATDIRGTLTATRARIVYAADIGGSTSITGAREVDLKDVRGSASIVADRDGAVVRVDGNGTRRIGRGVGHITLQNIDGAVHITPEADGGGVP